MSCIMTVAAQRWGGALRTLDAYPLTVRVFNAVVAYVQYPINALWPQHLAVYYPHPGYGLSVWQIFGSLVILIGISYLAVRHARRRPYLLLGWVSYLGMLVPVIGLVQVGAQSLADRYTYVPLIGLFIIAAWRLPELLANRLRRNAVLWVGGILVLALLSVASARHVGGRFNFKVHQINV